MTTCNAALKQWETENGPLSEAKVVKLIAQIPPISKLDNSLNSLTKCEQLSLSTNNIDRLIPLGGMPNLKILSIGRNCFRSLSKLEEVSETLTELWASYNQINNLEGISCCKKLENLYLSNNNIKDWDELNKLASCTELKDILLIGNPIYDDLSVDERRIKVLQKMTANKNLSKIDNVLIKPHEREAAAQ